MLTRFVRIRNGSEVRQRIQDLQFPGGYVDLEPGGEIALPAAVYQRVARRCQRWMRNLDAMSGGIGAVPDDGSAKNRRGEVGTEKT